MLQNMYLGYGCASGDHAADTAAELPAGRFGSVVTGGFASAAVTPAVCAVEWVGLRRRRRRLRRDWTGPRCPPRARLANSCSRAPPRGKCSCVRCACGNCCLRADERSKRRRCVATGMRRTTTRAPWVRAPSHALHLSGGCAQRRQVLRTRMQPLKMKVRDLPQGAQLCNSWTMSVPRPSTPTEQRRQSTAKI